MNNFNYIGPINNTGYGVASMGYLSALLEQKPEIGFKPIGQVVGCNQEAVEKLQVAAKRYDPSLPSFCFWHLFDMPNHIKECTGPKVGMTTFELNELKKQEIDVINSLDAICTASNWGKGIINNTLTNTSIHVIPHAFKETNSTVLPKHRFDEDLKAVWEKVLNPIRLPDDTLFLSTAGKYESRKGHPELIDACIKVGKEKPIVLIAFVHNPFILDGFPYSYINSKFMYPVYTKSGIKVFNKGNFLLVLMPPTKERQELHSALNKADFFISPSKAEGWNLPLFEMMSLGMPCITTRYSAHTEYCFPENCIQIYSDELVPAFDNLFFNGFGKWANITQFNIYEAIMHAKLKVKGTPTIKQISEDAIKVTNRFSWENSAKQIISLMSRY